MGMANLRAGPTAGDDMASGVSKLFRTWYPEVVRLADLQRRDRGVPLLGSPAGADRGHDEGLPARRPTRRSHGKGRRILGLLEQFGAQTFAA